MKSFEFMTDGGDASSCKTTPRPIKFRGKCIYTDLWVTGTYMYTNDDKNNPFSSCVIRDSHRIISYYSGDWNLGGWNDTEIHPITLGQFTGLKDMNGVEIYEGDIVRVYYGISYDENGDVTISDEYNEFVVSYHNGSFFFGYECTSDFDPWETYAIYVVGNVFDSITHQAAVDYNVSKMLDNFTKNSEGNTPPLIELAFLPFATEIVKNIPMTYYLCKYEGDKISIVFKTPQVSQRFMICLQPDTATYSGTGTAKDGSACNCTSDNLNNVITNILNCIKTWI